MISPNGGFDFDWQGQRTYLALYDMMLNDGGMSGDEIAPVRMLDMRTRMPFLPTGARVHGWCDPIVRTNSFTVLYFDQAWLLDELKVAPRQRSLLPMVYFQNRNLRPTLAKMGEVAREATAPRSLMDALAIQVGAELFGGGERVQKQRPAAKTGRSGSRFCGRPSW